MSGKLLFLVVCAIILIIFTLFNISLNESTFSIKQLVPSSCNIENPSFEKLSDFLYTNVSIFCLIHSSPKYKNKRAIHQKATWLKRCNNYIFVSSDEDKSLPAIKGGKEDGYQFSNERIRYGLTYVYENFGNKYDWFLKGDDDNYIIMENLRTFLLLRDSSIDQYYGFKLKLNHEYMSGAGFILSKSALEKMVTIAFKNNTICSDKPNIPEDVEFGNCLKNINILPMDSRDSDNKHMFVPSSFDEFSSMIKNSHFDGFVKMSPYEIKKGYTSLSKYPISFHYVTGDMFYGLEYLFYHASVIGKESEVYKYDKYSYKNDFSISFLRLKEFIKKFYKFDANILDNNLYI
ncbi:Glycoprotein-N-acetylgalactosamine 3-beta-galactosyltransferase 1 [Strongyloides ratti]|uniref:N-acetylgalactosaminide beta-1,3-galactosyltransferase n=1 Tax=Strongyloides ratti TaxID=34506 RepID=A0A090L0S1_STRRB|nr:Glycoprotein-N-acetylgalactosamine 3-beta-galactosyltransferase 1 [Strongyloides ratti]CEF63266.1 Glycoprotein-N-acetylgalactosamine 3-beta-galactosyltransferase 1 [Strongyloides ratti]